MPITRPLRSLAPLLALALAGCGGDEPAPDAGLLPDGGPPPARDMRAPEPADGGPDLDLQDADAPEADAAPDAAPDMATGPACANGADDDGDGRVDLDDPGCAAADDDDEQDPPAPPACANGLDDDDDGLTDHPADPDCAAAGGDDEGPLCGALGVTTLDPAGTTTVRLWPRPPVTGASCGEAAGEAAVGTLAVDGPALVRVSVEAPGPVRLFARARCRDRLSELDCRAPGEGAVELAVEGDVTLFVFVQAAPGFPDGVAVDVPVTVEVIPVADTCRNGLDDDGDGRIDQADPGCSGATDDDEADPTPLPECGNGLDDDGDGATDWPDDPECNAAGGLREGLACDGIEAVSLGLGRHALAFAFDSTVPGETRGQCGGNGDEAVAVLAVDRPASLYARVTTPEAGSMATYLRRDCRDRFTDAVCDAAFTEREIVVDRLEIGTWFLFFDHDVGFAQRVDEIEATVELIALDRRACEDGADNDGDGRVDLADPGCARPGDDDEADPAPIARCSNGLDDDGDGATDWPADPACPAAGSDAEGRDCLGDAPVIPVGEAGGTFLVDARPLATGTAIAGCGGDLGAETVFALTLRRPADLRVRLDGAARFGRSRIFVRGTCADEDSERGCATEGRLTLDALAEGTWYVFVELGETTQPGPPPSITFEVASLIGECNDELDNDGDGRVDLADPGCVQGRDPSEADPLTPPECSNGVDDDGDGATDWPDDAQCRAAGGEDEAPVCGPGVEVVPIDPGGGRIDVPFGGDAIGPICGGQRDSTEIAGLIVLDEPSRVSPRLVGGRGWYDLRTTCDDPETSLACAQFFDFNRPLAPGSYYLLLAANAPGMSVDVEIESLVRQCNDAVDNDGDGRVDLADPGCVEGQDDDEADPPEAPACADGLDNDDDGAIDWPDDPECTAAGGLDEDRRCPALGAELRLPAEGGEVDVDTRGLPNVLAGRCGGGGAPEVAVTLHLDAPAQVVAEVVAADYDTLVYIIDRCEDRAREPACDDDSGNGNWSRVEARLDAGDWVIVVDGFGDDSGTATLRVDVVPELMP